MKIVSQIFVYEGANDLICGIIQKTLFEMSQIAEKVKKIIVDKLGQAIEFLEAAKA